MDWDSLFPILIIIVMGAFSIWQINVAYEAMPRTICESIGEEYKSYSMTDKTISCSETTLEFPKQKTKTIVFCPNCTEEKQ